MEFKIALKGHNELRQKLEELGRKGGTVIARAINKVSLAMRTESIQQIRTQYNIKAAELKGPEGIQFSRANKNRLYAIISVAGTRLSLIKFGAKEVKARGKGRRTAGVSVMVLRGNRVRLKRAFIRRLRYGEAVLQRKTKARYPIIPPLYSLSVPAMLRAMRIRKVWERVYNDKMMPTLSHEVKAELMGWAKGRWE